MIAENTSRSSAQEIDTRFSRDSKNANLKEAKHDRTGRPVVCREPVGSLPTPNEADIDFRVSGLPHSAVKQAENSRVRELVKKFENHPHRQDLQADLQKNNAYNPFSEKSKKMIKDMGNVELLELCERISQKCSAKSAFFTGIKASFIALAGNSWKQVKPTEVSFNVHWTFFQFKIMS